MIKSIRVFMLACLVVGLLSACQMVWIANSRPMPIAVYRAPIQLELPITWELRAIFSRVSYVPATALYAHFSPTEIRILTNVANEYALTEEQRILLFAIRKVENGRPGRELGCGDVPGWHPARRYAGNFEKSLHLQAEYACGTIQNHWQGNTYAFAKRYCPYRPNWWSTHVNRWMARLN